MNELEALYLSVKSELMRLKAERSYYERITWIDKALIKCQFLTVPRMLEQGYVSALNKSLHKLDACYRQILRRIRREQKESEDN